MSCAVCGRTERARAYCHAPGCGTLAALGDALPPAHARYNSALLRLKTMSEWMLLLANAAYEAASAEAAPGPRERLLRIADKASDFAVMVDAAEPM